MTISQFLNRLFCKHKHLGFDDREHSICFDCGGVFPIPTELARPSGVYARIEKRIEQEEEYKRLVNLGTAYLEDKEYSRENEN